MRYLLWASALVCAAGAGLSACGSSDDDPPGGNTGGVQGTGGAPASGGASANGGAPANGGAATTGGVANTGGIGAGGGPQNTGGTVGSGGAPGSGGLGSGGSQASGGASSGGASTGGTQGSGGGSTVPPSKSTGCGAATFPPSGTQTIDVSGTQREFIVKIPTNYSANTAYKLVFAWHGLGGTAASIARSYYGLESRSAGSTIFVAGQGLETGSGGAGWPNTGGRDIALVRAMLDYLKKSYCIDQERIFSTGMSYGGIMSNTIGCQLGDVFRAIAPIAGSGPRAFGGSQCVGQVAAWLAHGNADDVVTFASGQASRDHWLTANHCQTATTPTDPSPCVAYQGCDAGHPVHWCEFAGGHTVPPFASAAIWNFFSQF